MRVYPTLVAIIVCWAAIVPAAPLRAQGSDLLTICADPATNPYEAVRYCRSALDLRGLTPETRARILANLGLAQSATGRHVDAINTFTDALAEDPSLIALYIYRARARESRGDLDAAMADFATALAKAPGSAEARAERGAMLLRNANPEAALADLDRVVRMRSTWTAARFNRAMALLALGRPEGAEADLTIVIAGSPDDADAHLQRARARAAMGRADAGADYDAALRLSPEWAEAWYARGRWHDTLGDREAANRDLLRARELGYSDAWLEERVRAISG